MHKLKPIVAETPEELAGALGLSGVAAREWQVQDALLKRLKKSLDSGRSLTRTSRREQALHEPG